MAEKDNLSHLHLTVAPFKNPAIYSIKKNGKKEIKNGR